jgi:glycosyltransferase involved in cell wall biosynthesis
LVTVRPMDDDRRRVLVLAYFFPPVAGAGVQRILKFVRYLAALGWDATVVSTRSRVYGVRDPSLLAEVPTSTRVIRTPALPLARYLAIVLYKLRLRRLRAWVLWPDNGLGWAPFAFVAALRAVRRDHPDVLLSTSAPYGSHLVALLVAQMTGLPWVADFRDEWTTNPHLADQPRPLAALAARAERAITARANRVVLAADYFQLAGLSSDDSRRVVIPNGVDEDDLPRASAPDPPAERFVLAHVGTLYDIRDPAPALRALASLAAREAVDRELVEVRLVGNVWLTDFAPPPGIRVETTGYVEHAQAIEEMHAATVLLLYVPSSSLAPSGKLFEYLASGRPLLCLARPDNLASRLVSDWDAGVVADPHNETAIERAILALWRRWQEDGLLDNKEVRERTLQHFSRRANAARLAQVLEEAGGG